MTEKAFNLQFVSMLGNFQLLLRSIGSGVVLTMPQGHAACIVHDGGDVVVAEGKEVGHVAGFAGEGAVVADVAGHVFVSFVSGWMLVKTSRPPSRKSWPHSLMGRPVASSKNLPAYCQ